MPSALETFSKKFPTNEPCKLWDAIQASTTHTDPTEKRAVARAIVKDILSSYAGRYVNAYCHEVCQSHSGRPFAAYSIGCFRGMPTFAKRASKKREKTILGWVYSFLTEAGEEELLTVFEKSITASLTK